LEPEEKFTPGLRRIAHEQIGKALDHLRQPGDDPDEAIHEARKHFKKIRAIMRLVRDELGSSIYKRENVTYRDAGRRLSDMRDSYVKVETLDDLEDEYSDELADGAFDDMRQTLVERHEAVRRHTLDAENAMVETAETIAEAQGRIEELPLGEISYDDIAPSIYRVYKRGYKGMARSYDSGDPEDFHDWRKRVKYLWYHSRILRRLWPDMMEELADQVHDLSDYLGDAHDMAEFEELIEEEPELISDEESREVLAALLRRRRKALEAKGRPLAQRIYAEEPDEFVARIGGYWKAWEMGV
jgi:CHAD domain-containing protein